MTRRSIIFSLFCFICFGCNSPRVTTAWKVEHTAPRVYDKILVAGVIKSTNDSLRVRVERHFAESLNGLGYNAVTMLTEFGKGGLSDLGEAETYRKLCNNGIDAVIIIALIDKNKESKRVKRGTDKYPNNYYYNRIWDYKNIQADLASENNGNDRFFWESILFNLNTLQAECTVQTASFKTTKKDDMENGFENLIIQKMIKEKVLAVQPQKPKPF